MNIKNIRFSIIEEVCRRIDVGLLRPMPLSVRDSELREGVYQISSQLIKAYDGAQLPTNEKATKIYEEISKVLRNTAIDTGTKFLLLSYFVGGTIVEHKQKELENVFMSIANIVGIERVKGDIDFVFTEATNRYFTATSGCIYDFEENFFFTMYHHWDGEYGSTVQKSIIAAAELRLEEFPEALKLYWERFPYNKNWSHKMPFAEAMTFEDSEANASFAMNLDKLIEKTVEASRVGKDVQEIVSKEKLSFWRELNNQEEFRKIHYKKEGKATEGYHTLRNLLKQQGLIN